MNEKIIHHFTSDEKLLWWDYGEWVEEPDEISFQHMTLECKIIRIAVIEPSPKEFIVFGGYLCGYVKIPESYPFYNKENIFDFNINIHGGITYCTDNLSEEYWIGFDCAHSNDLTPSTEKLRKKLPELLEIDIKIDTSSSIWKRTYKNIEFVKNECKSMADQVLEMHSRNT